MNVGTVVTKTLTQDEAHEVLTAHAFDGRALGRYPLAGEAVAGVVVRDLGGASNLQLLLDGSAQHWLRNVADTDLTVVP